MLSYASADLKIRKEHEEMRAALREGQLDGEALASCRSNLQRAVVVALRILHGSRALNLLLALCSRVLP